MKYLPALLLCSFLCSCDRPECTNTNTLLLRYPPESREYKVELRRLLNTPAHSNADFWIDGYTTVTGREYMTIYVQDESLCAKALLDITKTNELMQFKKVMGQAYSGAQLKGLEYHIDSAGDNYSFVFDHVRWIAD